MEKEVIITYETLFEILRREKTREELQKLPENFSDDVRKYLHEKKQTMLSISNDQFSDIEQEKTQRQIINIKKILNELYEKREKKIVAMALNKSRMPKSVIEITTIADNEKQFYDKLLSTFNEARIDSLRSMIIENAAMPEEKPQEAKKAEDLQMEESEDLPDNKPSEKPAFKVSDSGTQKVRFICETSQFVGPNLEIYGPFKTEEIAVLPVSVCNVLINKNKAQIEDS